MLAPRRLARAFTELTASRSAAVGVAIILFWIFVAVAAPLIAPYGPTEMHDARLEAPSLQHWLGTDHLARDVMSRLFWGTRVVVALAPISVFLGILMAAAIMNLLQEFQRQYGTTILFISHDLSAVYQLCDNVAVMYLGQICETGPRSVG